MLHGSTVSAVASCGRMTSVTFEHGSVGYVPFHRYQAERIPLGDPIFQAAAARDPVCQVCKSPVC